LIRGGRRLDCVTYRFAEDDEVGVVTASRGAFSEIDGLRSWSWWTLETARWKRGFDASEGRGRGLSV